MHVIHCPACDAGLRLPRAMLAKRARRICCAICEHRWMEAAIIEAEPPVIENPDAPEISLLAESSRDAPSVNPPNKVRKARSARKPWGLSRRRPDLSRFIPRSFSHKAAAVTAALLVLFCIAKRDAIVRTAPGLAGAYAAIGLPVNLAGLQWRDVKTVFTTEASHRVLAVEGEIRNVRDQSQALPDLRLSLRDDDGREVYHWTAPAPKANLDQRETVQFRARLVAPPDSAKAVRVTFAQVER